MTDQMDDIQTILTDVDEILRQRLAAIGLDLAHLLLVISPDGEALIRANVMPPDLVTMAADLKDAAEEAMKRPPDNEPIH